MSGPLCAVCGRPPDSASDGDPPLGWSSDLDDAGAQRRICPQCTRRHVRAIEAKLEQEWW